MNQDGVPQDSGDWAGIGNCYSPPKACALIMPVWGSSYVGQFLDYCLPTLLAPGNIPALTQALPTRFILLTRLSDLSVIVEHPAWRHLAERCHADIQPIDDLVADGNHHATITLAYARSLRATGKAMTDTVFFFLVGDYLVADGSLHAVLKRIRSGASGVMAGSLQMSAEAAVPLLRDRLQSSSCELALAPRLLASWALAYLHPSNAAGLINVSLLHNHETNKLFWTVDKHTLIARFYLLHMIAIRPEVTDFVVGAPCDYSFIPELCPSNRIAVLTDSDDYLVVEMQAHDRGVGLLRWGPLPPSALGRSLSRWTTALHRQNANTTLVFHSEEIPQQIAETEAMATEFTAEVGNSLASAPQPHRGHPFWIGMMALQRAGEKPEPGRNAWAHLLGAEASSGGLTGLLWRLRLQILGHPPNVTPAHPRWPDFHAAYAIMKKCLNHTDRLLVVSNSPRAFAQWLGPLSDTVESVDWELDPIPPCANSSAAAETFDVCLWAVERNHLPIQDSAIDRISRMLKPGGCLVILVTGDLNDEPAAMRRGCADLGLHLQRSGIRVEKACYVPMGAPRAALARAMAGSIRAAGGKTRAFLPLLLAAGALIVGAVLACNLMVWIRRSSRRPSANCSSVIITGRCTAGQFSAETASSTIDCQNVRRYDGPEFSVSSRSTGPSLAGVPASEVQD
jgi:hypothetical protein